MPGVRQESVSPPLSAAKQAKQNLIPRRRGPTPTPVFDAYWHFAAERQRIFRERLLGHDWTTKDVVLQRYRFTNAYRASDRVSQYLITHVIYDRDRDWKDIFLRVVLFKLFNKIETWRELESRLGTVDSLSFDVELYTSTLNHIREVRGTLYSAAYIMPPAQAFGSNQKHVNHLRLLQHMLEMHLHLKLLECQTGAEAFKELVSFPSIGPFLAYQLLTDLSYASQIPFTEAEFVCAGPGALDGLRKCFSDPGDFTPAELIAWTVERQEEEFAKRDLHFEDLWGRPLQLIDCQNLYCEVGKYAREAFPGVAGTSGRKRIKQGFRPHAEPLSSWYPPKWGLNGRVEAWLGRRTLPSGVS